MIHPLHRDSPYPGDLAPLSPVERLLLVCAQPHPFSLMDSSGNQRRVQASLLSWMDALWLSLRRERLASRTDG